MPKSSSHRHSSRSYSRDRDKEYKRRSSSEDDYYDRSTRKKSYRRSRSPSSSSRSKTSYRSSKRRSHSSDEEYYYKKRSAKSQKDKNSRKSKRSHRSRSSSSKSSSSLSDKSRSASKQKSNIPSPSNPLENEYTSKTFNLHLLDGKITSETLEDIESDKFQSKNFTSNNINKQSLQKVYIDLNKDSVCIPTSNDKQLLVNSSLFHPNFLGDEVEKSEKWIKKLFNFRQKLLRTT